MEGLNQEIERIVLKTDSIEYFLDRGDKLGQITPEGHRAPLAELFRTRSRSVNTQTPNIGDLSSNSGTQIDNLLSLYLFSGVFKGPHRAAPFHH